MLRESNPTLMLRKFPRVRTSNPAPTSTTIASATCATTRALPTLNQRPPSCATLDETPAPSFSAGVKSRRALRNAGAMPNRIPVKSEITAVNARTRMSKPAANPSARV